MRGRTRRDDINDTSIKEIKNERKKEGDVEGTVSEGSLNSEIQCFCAFCSIA